MSLQCARQYAGIKIIDIVHFIAHSLHLSHSFQLLYTYWSKAVFWGSPAYGTVSVLQGFRNTEHPVYILKNSVLQWSLQWQSTSEKVLSSAYHWEGFEKKLCSL